MGWACCSHWGRGVGFKRKVDGILRLRVDTHLHFDIRTLRRFHDLLLSKNEENKLPSRECSVFFFFCLLIATKFVVGRVRVLSFLLFLFMEFYVYEEHC
jgi:hypothetical protein